MRKDAKVKRRTNIEYNKDFNKAISNNRDKQKRRRNIAIVNWIN